MKKLLLFLFLGWVEVMLALSEPIVFKNSYGITSLQQQIDFYQPPMAHASQTLITMNVNNTTQSLLHFSDLFSKPEQALKIVSLYSQTYFLNKLEDEKLPKANKELRQEMIIAGTSPKLENFHYWNIDHQFLKITFAAAQVEPRYYGAQTLDIPLSLLASVIKPSLFPDLFQLHIGDLLFQDLNCGELCDAINVATYGYEHTLVSHVAMVVSLNNAQPAVIEAIGSGVQLTSLDSFLLRSLDERGHPRVMVGRVDDELQPLLASAVTQSLSHLHAPYNDTFSPKGKGFYCSELVLQSFYEANHYHAVFPLYPMNFKELSTQRFPVVWRHYFSKRNQPIPQGELGSNPGQLSRDAHINIEYFYGDLRHST